MLFPFFTKKTQDKTLALLVDIGSSSVGCAIVRIEKGKEPHVLASVREDIPFQESLSSSKFLLAMSHALECALKSVQVGSNHHNVQSVFCTLSSPWFILRSRHLSVSKKESFEITEEAMNGFLNEDIERLKDELKTTLPPKDIRIIEKKIIQVKLNGYEVGSPYHQKTSNIDILMTVGVSSEKVIQSIERKIGQLFHSKSIHFGVFPIAAFSAVRDIFPTEKNFIFLDVTGEATDVSLVAGDILSGTASFPRGKNFFVREISTQFKTLHHEAETLFAMFLRNELSPAKHEMVSSVVSRAENEWVTRFEKAITSLSRSGVLPRKVFFTADSEIATLFSKAIMRARSEFLLVELFEARYLDPLIVSNFVSFEPKVVRDPFIVIEALLAEKIVSQHI